MEFEGSVTPIKDQIDQTLHRTNLTMAKFVVWMRRIRGRGTTAGDEGGCRVRP